MKTKEGMYGKPVALRLKGEPLKEAIQVKQALELKEGRPVALAEIVRMGINALYRSEIEGNESKEG